MSESDEEDKTLERKSKKGPLKLTARNVKSLLKVSWYLEWKFSVMLKSIKGTHTIFYGWRVLIKFMDFPVCCLYSDMNQQAHFIFTSRQARKSLVGIRQL